LNCNIRLRQLAQNTNNVILLDVYNLIIDPTSATGAAQAGMLENTAFPVHFSQKGGRTIGAALTTILQRVLNNGFTFATCSGLDAYDASNNPTPNNVFTNGNLLTATGGTILGGSGAITNSGIAAGVTVATFGSVTLATASVVADSTGFGNAQQLVGTPGAANDLMRVLTDASKATSATLVTAGDWYVAGCYLVTSGLAGQNILLGCELRVLMTANGSTTTNIRDKYTTQSSATYVSQTDYADYFETPPFQIPSGVTALSIDLQLKFAAAGTPVTMQVSRIYISKTTRSLT
jgi:hypothetical protein